MSDRRAQSAMGAAEVSETQSGQPSPDIPRQVKERAVNGGRRRLGCGVYGNVSRILDPLAIAEAQFRQALDIISASLTR